MWVKDLAFQISTYCPFWLAGNVGRGGYGKVNICSKYADIQPKTEEAAEAWAIHLWMGIGSVWWHQIIAGAGLKELGMTKKKQGRRKQWDKGRVNWLICSTIRVKNRCTESLTLLQLKSSYDVNHFILGPGLAQMKCSYCVDVGYQKFHGFRSLLFDIKVLFFLIRNCSRHEMFVFSVNESKQLKMLYFLNVAINTLI